jgi:hypothetical protein
MKRLYYVDPDQFAEPVDQDLEVREESEGLLTKAQKSVENTLVTIEAMVVFFLGMIKVEAKKVSTQVIFNGLEKRIEETETDLESLRDEYRRQASWLKVNLWAIETGKYVLEDNLEFIVGEAGGLKRRLLTLQDNLADEGINLLLNADNVEYWQMKVKASFHKYDKLAGELDTALLEETIPLASWELARGTRRAEDMTNEELVTAIEFSEGSAWELHREYARRIKRDLVRAEKAHAENLDLIQEDPSWVNLQKARISERLVKTLRKENSACEQEEENRMAIERVNRAKKQNNIIMDTDNSVFMVDCSTCAGHKTVINTETWEDEVCPHCKGTGLIDFRS